MSRFKNEVARRLCRPCGGLNPLFAISLMLDMGWWQAPRDLTIHLPPDLRFSSAHKR